MDTRGSEVNAEGAHLFVHSLKTAYNLFHPLKRLIFECAHQIDMKGCIYIDCFYFYGGWRHLTIAVLVCPAHALHTKASKLAYLIAFCMCLSSFLLFHST